MAVLAVFALVSPAQAAAEGDPIQAPATVVSRDFPPNSFGGEGRIAAARAAVEQARHSVAWAVYDAEVACHRRFLVSNCLRDVKLRARSAYGELREVELGAVRTEREAADRDRQQARDRAAAEALAGSETARVRAEQDQADLARRQAESERARTEFDAAAPARERNADAELRRRAEREAARDKAIAEQAAQRAAAQRDYERKQTEARARQEEMARRRAERQGNASPAPAASDAQQ
ncbi:hypothetical protein [Derxia lacustris]|uniref:hypothetical protein n=1 Tax=Derxia lacustris TaxID=764842 RepID=UPI00111BEF02|nr:hypothetical protein [Derxia lacustris]